MFLYNILPFLLFNEEINLTNERSGAMHATFMVLCESAKCHKFSRNFAKFRRSEDDTLKIKARNTVFGKTNVRKFLRK